jgi:hypothetical protein
MEALKDHRPAQCAARESTEKESAGAKLQEKGVVDQG